MGDHRALLQTDVVDSTRLSERLGDDAVTLLWAKHDRLSRDLLRTWRGQEIDKSDGFLLTFATVQDAVGYALDYHKALASLREPLKARAGIHVGPLTTRENPSADVSLGAKPLELDGLAKPTTARVMSLALGGQTLLTAAARAALGSTLVRVQSHGHWRMKGLREPFELFEVGDDQAPFTPPPDVPKVYRVARRNDLWVPVRLLRHSLPAERDAFVGREASLLEIAHRIDTGARLVSVLGVGGIGKTRIAQRFSWIWLGDFSGGVWFCDLSQAGNLDGIVQAVAKGIDVPLGKEDPVAQLGNALAGRGPCLVILDNFEQVSRYAEGTVGRWLDRAGEARFIVTTREVLGIPGEEVMALTPLEPKEAETLFLRRAQAAKRDFKPEAQDPATIVPLVRLLDGLPLAIELAAARVRVMPPRTLLERMSERFKLLTSTGRRGRQATLRTTFDWSWDLLSATEKMALAQLSVFEGGFTLAAAEATLDFSPDDKRPAPIDVLQSLVEKSLVRRLTDYRFDLLSSVQEYAAERLAAERHFPGDISALTSAQSRHWQYFAKLDEKGAVADGCVELDNLVAACRRAGAHGDAGSAVGALVATWAALVLRGPFQLAVDLAATLHRMPDMQDSDCALVQWVEGSALYMLGQATEAGERFRIGLDLASRNGNQHVEARLRCALGDLLTDKGCPEEALENLTRARSQVEDLKDRLLLCKVLNGLGALCNNCGRLAEARSHFEAALGIARELGDARWIGGLLGNLGTLHYADGHLDDSITHHRNAMALAQATGDRRWEANAHCNLGLLLHERGNPADAHAHFESALAMAREMGHVRSECTVLCNLGILLAAQDKWTDAQTCYERAIALAHEIGDRRSEGQFRGYLGLLHARQGRFGVAKDCFEVGEVLLREISDQLSLSLLLCCRAESEHAAGETDNARVSLRKAKFFAEQVGASASSELWRRIHALRTSMDC